MLLAKNFSISDSSGWITEAPSGKSMSCIGINGLAVEGLGLRKSGNSGRSISSIGLEKKEAINAVFVAVLSR